MLEALLPFRAGHCSEPWCSSPVKCWQGHLDLSRQEWGTIEKRDKYSASITSTAPERGDNFFFEREHTTCSWAHAWVVGGAERQKNLKQTPHWPLSTESNSGLEPMTLRSWLTWNQDSLIEPPGCPRGTIFLIRSYPWGDLERSSCWAVLSCQSGNWGPEREATQWINSGPGQSQNYDAVQVSWFPSPAAFTTSQTPWNATQRRSFIHSFNEYLPSPCHVPSATALMGRR